MKVLFLHGGGETITAETFYRCRAITRWFRRLPGAFRRLPVLCYYLDTRVDDSMTLVGFINLLGSEEVFFSRVAGR